MATQTGSIDLKAAKQAHDDAEKVATNYVADISNGILVHPENDQQNGVRITNKVDILRSNVSVMAIGETNTTTGNDVVRIGKSGETRAEIDYHSLKLIDKEGNSYFHVSDLRSNNGEATLQDQYYALGKTRFDLGIYASSITSVLINNTETTNYTVEQTSDGIRTIVLNAPTASQSDIVTINYVATSELAKAFTIGIRDGLTGVGAFSVAEGYLVRAKGAYTHAEGMGTKAMSNYAHAEGCQSQGNGLNSHAEGYNAKANGDTSHAEGSVTKADGNYSHAEGSFTTASGSISHAEGSGSEASGDYSHAEGSGSEASGYVSHAEGYESEASGYYSHAEGRQSEASGGRSHAEGSGSEASGYVSHAEGYESKADGDYSHAQNYKTIAQRMSQTAIGEFNVADTTGADGTAKGDYIVIVGNGTSDNNRSNALTVAWTGDVVASGDITDGNGNVLSDKIEASDVPTNETDPTVPSWAKASTKPSYSASEISGLIDMFYPVGSYYETSDSTFNPNTAWGGTWVEDSAGRVTVAQNASETEFDVVGETGGSKYIQNHAHDFTQPVPKIPKDAITTESTSVAHTHGPDGATYHLVTNASAVGRRTIKNGTGTSYADNIYTNDGAIVRKTATAGMSANANHTHKLPNADYSITNRTTDGAVKGVQTTSHTTMSTGSSGNLQPYVVVKRWHRTA